ncbi:hypothetical protein J6590_077545 [Homalodisca vitripennis]|nr:hypothetical protein J6590_077545 [Homalodisca vitripennis]
MAAIKPFGNHKISINSLGKCKTDGVFTLSKPLLSSWREGEEMGFHRSLSRSPSIDYPLSFPLLLATSLQGPTPTSPTKSGSISAEFFVERVPSSCAQGSIFALKVIKGSKEEKRSTDEYFVPVVFQNKQILIS